MHSLYCITLQMKASTKWNTLKIYSEYNILLYYYYHYHYEYYDYPYRGVNSYEVQVKSIR